MSENNFEKENAPEIQEEATNEAVESAEEVVANEEPTEATEEEAIVTPEEPTEAKEEYIEIEVNGVTEEKPKKKSAAKEILDWFLSIAIAVAAVVVLNMFVFVQVVVDGQSMYPTLHNKDRLIATRLMYTPEAGDIVVVEPYLREGSVKGKLMFGRTLYIKRVVAKEGQAIDFKDGKVYIDGKLYEEAYIPDDVKTLKMTTRLPAVVPEGHVFVMGDNRENSRDSRDASIGMISYDKVVGKAVFRLLPFSDFGKLK